MLQIVKTQGDCQQMLTAAEEGCWINLITPTEEELRQVETETGVLPEFLRASLDEEERSRIEWDEDSDQTLILVDIPGVEKEGNAYIYTTIPLGLIHTPEYIISVCLKDSSLIRDFAEGRVRGFATYKKTRFIYQFLYRNAGRYLRYLRQIDQTTDRVHKKMQKSYRNQELFQMMMLEKSLVFFSTSLKSNEIVLERLIKVDYVRKYVEDQDLLEDVIVENKQAIEMCSIYRDILSGTMDAYASIISNNLNIVMKFMTAMTIVLSLPTIVSSFWGMNVAVPWQNTTWGFPVVLSLALGLSLAAAIIMWRKKMF